MMLMQKKFGRIYYPYSIYVLNNVSMAPLNAISILESTQNTACFFQQTRIERIGRAITSVGAVLTTD